jgi:hypothetical protein
MLYTDEKRYVFFNNWLESPSIDVSRRQKLSNKHDPNWHKDDILTLAFCPPSTLVTASYGNEVSNS